MSREEVSHQEKLARVIEPNAWEIRDNILEKGLSTDAAEYLIEASMNIAEKIIKSGLMASETWDRKEYTNAKAHILDITSRRGYCYSVSDTLDGYFMHDPRCQSWPQGACGGSGCIKP